MLSAIANDVSDRFLLDTPPTPLLYKGGGKDLRNNSNK